MREGLLWIGAISGLLFAHGRGCVTKVLAKSFAKMALATEPGCLGDGA